jgi:hypothetical protein
MQLSVQPVTFYPVPPVKPVVRQTDEAAAELRAAQAQVARQVTPSHLGRNLDLKV